MKNDIDYELLLRHIRKETNKEEDNLVREWLSADPDNINLYDLLRKSYDDINSDAERIDVENAWNIVAERAGIKITESTETGKIIPIENTLSSPQTASNSLRFGNILKYAAVFVFLFTIPFMVSEYFEFGEMDAVELNELIVENGTQSKITLIDGTIVILDASSKFSYPDQFDEDLREVWLEGEGFFEVEPDNERPFIVHAGNTLVRVLGTKFNVRAWQDTEYEKIIVTEGRVSFEIEGDPSTGVILEKNQMSLVRDGRPTEPVVADAEKSTAWMRYEMDFDDVKLGEIFNQLERWYSVKIDIDNTEYLDLRLKLFIPNRPVDSILDLLSSLTGFEYEKAGKKILFKTK